MVFPKQISLLNKYTTNLSISKQDSKGDKDSTFPPVELIHVSRRKQK